MEDSYKFVVSIMCMWGDSTIALLWVEGQTNARSVYLGQMGLCAGLSCAAHLGQPDVRVKRAEHKMHLGDEETQMKNTNP